MSSGAFAAAEGPLVGTGLAVGLTAIQLSTSADFSQCNGARTGQASFAGYLGLVSAPSGAYAGLARNTTAFAVTPVPVLENVALLLVGLGVMGSVVRRRKAAGL